MAKRHRRRDGYWRVYHRAHTHELDALVDGIVSLVKENEPPCKVKRTTKRGRKPVHSWEKLVCICLLMIILGYTLRDMQNEVPKLDLPWDDEPYPDHSTIHRAYQKIPQEYLDALLERTVQLCIKEARWKKGVLASDSSGVETDRYHTVIRPDRRKKAFVELRERTFLKYHVIAILNHLIILRARVTSYRVNDSPMLRSMLKGFPRFPGSIFDADRGFDAEKNFERLYELLMLPNIKQIARQKGPKGKGRKRLRYRSKAAKEFDPDVYRWRGMIEAIFGAEESDGHSLKTRFRKEENRARWGPVMAIGWNLKVLNRLRCTKTLGMEVVSMVGN